MIATTANYDAAAQKKPCLPVYRFSVQDYSKTFVYRKTGRSQDYAWITSINDWSVSCDPQNGSYTIDDLVVSVVDVAAAVTHDLGLLLLEGRRCTLTMGFDGLADADYCTLFAGIVNTVTANSDQTYSFTCNDYQRLNQRLIYTEGNDGTTTTTETTYNPSHPYTIVTRVDTTDPTTSIVTTTAHATYADTGPSGPTGTFLSSSGGVLTKRVVTSRSVTTGSTTFTVYEQVTTITGFNTVTTITETYGAFALYTNVIVTSTVNQSNGTQTSTLTVTFTESGVLGTTVASDASVISSTNPRIVYGHPLDIMLDILFNQIGYATSDANVALIEAYRDQVFTGVEFYFSITGSVDAKDFIESQLLKPLGGYLFPNNTGQLCVGFAQPLPNSLTPVGAITPRNLEELPAIGVSTLVNVLSLRFDKDDGNTTTNTTISNTGYLAQSDNFYTPTIADLTDLTGEVAQEAATGADAVQGQLIIESDGMRSGFQGFLLAKMIANAIFAKYGFYNPVIEAPCLWFPLFKAEIADFVTITHPLLPNRREGVMGFTNQLFQVTKRSYSFDSMTVTFTLEDASGVEAFGSLRIAPNGKGGYTTVGAPDQARYIFMSGTNGKYSDGTTAGSLG
jgi:hypothetical protein